MSLLHGRAQEDDGLPLRHVSHLPLQSEAAAAVSPTLPGVGTVLIWQGGKTAQWGINHRSEVSAHQGWRQGDTARGQAVRGPLLLYFSCASC